MNFMKMLRLVLCALIVGIMVEHHAVAANVVAVARGGIAAAMDDKQNEELDLVDELAGDESEDGENDGDDASEGETEAAVVEGVDSEQIQGKEDLALINPYPMPNPMPDFGLNPKIRDFGSKVFDRGMKWGRDSVNYVRDIDYRGKANVVRQNWHRIYDNGFVKSCWSGIRTAYWHSRVIPSKDRDFNCVFVFGRGNATVALKTTDGYDFMVPADVIGNGFMNQHVSENFFTQVNNLKQQFGINVSSRVFYLLCSIKQMQRAQDGENVDALALFNTNMKAIGSTVLRFYDVELFDAIKACTMLKITDEVILGVLRYAVANALCKRYPVFGEDGKSPLFSVVRNHLVLFNDEHEILVNVIKQIVDEFLHDLKHKVVVAPLAKEVVAGERVLVPRELVPVVNPGGEPVAAKKQPVRRSARVAKKK